MKKFYISLTFNVFFVLLITGYYLFNKQEPIIPKGSMPVNTNKYSAFNELTSVIYTVQSKYYKDIDINQVVSYAIDGIVSNLDQYSSIIHNINYESVNEDYNVLKTIDKFSKSTSPHFINVDALTPNGGNKDVSVITNLSNKNTIDIDYSNYDVKVLDDNIGYLKIKSFTPNSYEEIYQILMSDLHNISSLIIDLKNNGGGFVEQAILFASLFLHKSPIVHIVSNKETLHQTFVATADDILEGKPIVILINHNTASAAEIITSALQDNHRSLIIGTPSYGKGYIQTLIPLNTKNKTAVKLTTGYYITPSGSNIQGTGITPDIIINEHTAIIKNPRLEKNKSINQSIANLFDTDITDINLAIHYLKGVL